MTGKELLGLLKNMPKEDLERKIRLNTDLDYGFLNKVYVDKQGSLALSTSK